MSVKLKNINPMDYAMLLTRINTAICQFNNTADQTEQAQQFIAKVDEVSTSRSQFFDNIEKRLSKLLDPNQTLIAWFSSKRGTLEVVLSKIKVRKESDPDYLKKYSPEFSEGLELTEKLLAMGDEDLSSLHIGDILKIKKSILELRSSASSESSSSSKNTAAAATESGASSAVSGVSANVAARPVSVPIQPLKPAFAEDFFYLFLYEVHNILTLHFREDVNATVKLDVELYSWYNALKTWNDKFKEELTTSERIKNGFPKRIKTILSQLTQLASAAKQSRVEEAITSGGETQDAEEGMEISTGGAPSPAAPSSTTTPTSGSSGSSTMNKYYPVDQLTSLYVIVQDLMSHEWKRLRRLNPTPADTTALNNKRRKINDDNSTKSKISSRALNRLDTTLDDEELRLRGIVESWPIKGDIRSTYSSSSLLNNEGMNHCSGLLSYTA